MNLLLRVSQTAAVLVILYTTAPAQSGVLPLWTGPIPGRIECPGYAPFTEHVPGGVKQLVRVVEPTLEYFPTPADGRAHPAVVICPGGGYARLADQHEGVQVARWLNENGIDGIVLRYRMPNDSIMTDKSIGPLQDVQEAIRVVRRHSGEWNVDPMRIGVLGFSAGGHLAASASTRFAEAVYSPVDTTSACPDFSILIYPVITMDTVYGHAGSRRNLLGPNPAELQVRRASNELRVGRDTPPAFLVHSWDDGAVSPMNSILYALSLRSSDVAVELHLYEKGGHGYGLGHPNESNSGWPGACIAWLKARGILP
jgi:acetyl esterase/lipase